MMSNQFLLDCEREFREEMAELYLQAFDNEEIAHIQADELMCENLVKLGFESGVNLFREMPKWYS